MIPPPEICQVGAVREEVPGPAQRDAVPDPDQHVGAGGQQGPDPGRAGKVAVHHPQPPGREQVPAVRQRLVRQHLPGLALAPAGPVVTPEAARVDAAEIRSSRSCGNGDESSAVPADPDAARFAGVSGTRISDPSIEPASRSPAVTAR